MVMVVVQCIGGMSYISFSCPICPTPYLFPKVMPEKKGAVLMVGPNLVHLLRGKGLESCAI